MDVTQASLGPVSSSWLSLCSEQTVAAAQRASRALSGPCRLLPMPACAGLAYSRQILVRQSPKMCSLLGEGTQNTRASCASRFQVRAALGGYQDVPGDGAKGPAGNTWPPGLGRNDRRLLMGPDRMRSGFGNSLEMGRGDTLREQSTALEREILRAGEGAYGAIATAFSTMVFMLRAIQSYAMHLRQHLSPLQKHDIQELMTIVQQEIHSSLLWLFQTVFSATPALMVSVMLLLANFTVHSAGSLAPAEAAVLDLLSASPIAQGLAYQEAAPESGRRQGKVTVARQVYEAPATESGGAGQFPLRKMAQKGEEGSPAQGTQWQRLTAVLKDDEAASTSGSSSGRQSAISEASTASSPAHNQQDPHYMQGLLEQAAKEMELEVPYHHVRLDQEVIRQLVAPLSVEVDPDNYPCFDRTELQYLNAIAKEPSNALLLGNMAMFMYVVRKDKERAHSYFQQALGADPEDGETLSRYASFLWLGLGDYERAEVAYKAAIASDPTNPYFTGSYAHFLWHARDEETSCPIGGVC